MTLAEQVTRDLLHCIGDAPLTFAWNGMEHKNAGTRGALIDRKNFGEGGFLLEPTVSLTTTRQKLDGANKLMARFPGDILPSVGGLVTIAGVEYRIEAVHTDEFSSGLLLDLVSKNRGAQ